MMTARTPGSEEIEYLLRQGWAGDQGGAPEAGLTGIGVGPKQAAAERQLMNELRYSKACADLNRALFDHGAERRDEGLSSRE